MGVKQRRRPRRGVGLPRRRQQPADGIWRQTGSGCLLVGHIKYPYDATYERRFKAGRVEELTVYATVKAGRDLPLRSVSVREIVRRPGVVEAGRAWWLPRA